MDKNVRRIDPLVILSSGSTPGSAAGAANYFTANLKDPLVVDAESRVALSSLMLDWDDSITITAGQNDSVGYKTMSSVAENEMVGTIPAGKYSTNSLAVAVTKAMNANADTTTKFGGWICKAKDKIENGYTITYKISNRIAPVDAVSINNMTYTTGTAKDGGTLVVNNPDASCSFKPIAMQAGEFSYIIDDNLSNTHQFYLCTGNGITDKNTRYGFKYFSDLINPAYIIPVIAGVDQTPIGTPPSISEHWKKDDNIFGRKYGNELQFYYTENEEDPLDPLTIPFLTIDISGAPSEFLETPALTPVIITPNSTGTEFKARGIKFTPDKFADTDFIMINGNLTEVYVTPFIEHLLFTPSDPLDATAYAKSTKPVLDFTAPNSLGPIMGFNRSAAIQASVPSASTDFNSTDPPEYGIKGTLDAFFVHSNLNIGSIIGGRTQHSSPGILAIFPAQTPLVGTKSYTSYEPAHTPVYKRLNLSGKKTITSITIEIKDRNGAFVSTIDGSIATIALQFLDAIAV